MRYYVVTRGLVEGCAGELAKLYRHADGKWTPTHEDAEPLSRAQAEEVARRFNHAFVEGLDFVGTEDIEPALELDW